MLNNNPELDNTNINQVITDVMPAIERLQQGEVVKTVDLFEPVVWQGTSKPDHIKLGKIIAALSRMKLLPLQITERTSANHLQFTVDRH